MDLSDHRSNVLSLRYLSGTCPKVLKTRVYSLYSTSVSSTASTKAVADAEAEEGAGEGAAER